MSKITLQADIQKVNLPIEEIIGIPNTVTIKAMEEDFLDYLKK